ncbi:mechanosensitive ion channel family protein [Motilimonas pumila]|uniref:Small-conductance mechanosensitive channel n=1 Tax=Motilimonas pumila TaxID=2303987 RepID=A0A418YF62_9GAMM|nr:mechanosensitive ion channel family protein [Motilimonas pumila]RJG47900.1 mechanosensitive ion channel family protein [Motilimonas pumila]
MKSVIKMPFLLILLLFTSLSFASELSDQLQDIEQDQQDVTAEQVKLEAVKGEERLFMEDVVQRQNEDVRIILNEVVEKFGEQHAAEITPHIFAQITYLRQSIKLSQEELRTLVSENKNAKPSERAELNTLQQKQLDILDEHYVALAETLEWAVRLKIDVKQEVRLLKKEIRNRAEMLSNMIHFLTERQSDLKRRLNTAADDDKAVLTQELQKATDQANALVGNLEKTVQLMDRYKQSTSDYKQLIFSITGDITTDVFDLKVVTGLAGKWLESFQDWALANTPTLLMRLLLFAVIMFITRSIARLVRKAVQRSVTHSTMKFSVLMQEFFIGLSGKVVFVLGLMVGVSQLGVELGPLLAGFGVAGVVVGLALQDTLSNFASGVMILIYRPFDVDDFVDVAGGVRGKVSHMSLVSTTIKTIDHQRLIIPNNKIWGDTINNISAENYRRVDMLFGIGYGDDIRKAEKVLAEILEAHPAVMKEEGHEYMIKVHALGESSVDFAVRPWVRNEDYWDVYWDVTREVKLRFDEENISIPFPQRDVHIYQHENT